MMSAMDRNRRSFWRRDGFMNVAGVLGALAASFAWAVVPPQLRPIPTSLQLLGYLLLALLGAFAGMTMVAVVRLVYDVGARRHRRAQLPR
jgi:biotin transporter BioY